MIRCSNIFFTAECFDSADARSNDAEALFGLFANHARVPGWIPDEIDGGVADAFERHRPGGARAQGDPQRGFPVDADGERLEQFEARQVERGR